MYLVVAVGLSMRYSHICYDTPRPDSDLVFNSVIPTGTKTDPELSMRSSMGNTQIRWSWFMQRGHGRFLSMLALETQYPSSRG